MQQVKKWIWQQKEYPNFYYDKEKFESLFLDIRYEQGLLDGIYRSIKGDDLLQTQVEILTEDALNTSAIEGVSLSRDSVRSSIMNRFGLEYELKDSSNRLTDGVINILLDATNHYEKEITLERIFGWQHALFPYGISSHQHINIASFRGDGDMQIVSGAIGKEKVHYIAPKRKDLEAQMIQFLKWINDDSDLSIVKAAVAHLWFVIIHPLDDGNGRIARALSDLVLARDASQTLKLYSVSQSIRNNRKAYYDVLQETTSGNLDITAWISWFLQMMLEALKEAQVSIHYITEKMHFWDRHRETVLNEKQIKVLNKLLDMGKGNFQGGLNTRKYAGMTKSSKPTASRDIKDLLEKGCLKQILGTAGRSSSYELN